MMESFFIVSLPENVEGEPMLIVRDMLVLKNIRDSQSKLRAEVNWLGKS